MNNQKQDEEQCTHERFKAKSICPNFWIEKWDDQREEGKFPGIRTKIEPEDDDDE